MQGNEYQTLEKEVTDNINTSDLQIELSIKKDANELSSAQVNVV